MEPVKNYMWDRFSEIIEANTDNGKMSEISIFSMRLLNSFIKINDALTRMQLLCESNKASVDRAMHLLSYKVDFLKNINKNFRVPQNKTTGKEAFQKWLYDQYRDGTFAPEEAIKKYEKEGYPCGKVSVRTLRYWIEATADMIEQKVWKIKEHILEKYKESLT